MKIKNRVKKARSNADDDFVIFKNVQCPTFRAFITIKVTPTTLYLDGKSLQHKIFKSQFEELYLLPHINNSQVLILKLKNFGGNNHIRKQFVVFTFNLDAKGIFEPPKKTKFAKEYNRLLQQLSTQPAYEVLSQLLEIVYSIKITKSSDFQGFFGNSSVKCSYGGLVSYLYPLENNLLLLRKSPIDVNFSDVVSVTFAYRGGRSKFFYLQIQVKSGVLHTISCINAKELYRLYRYMKKKKPNNIINKFETEKDHSDDDSTDDDFELPDQVDDEVAEEFDSNVGSSSNSEDETDSISEEDTL